MTELNVEIDILKLKADGSNLKQWDFEAQKGLDCRLGGTCQNLSRSRQKGRQPEALEASAAATGSFKNQFKSQPRQKQPAPK